VIDVWGFKKWAYGLVVIGTNAIFVYMLTHLVIFRSGPVVGNFVDGLDKFVGPWKDFTHSFAAFALVWLILFWMYRKKSFIKV
jgi:predicted acyltransferase